MVPKQPKTSGSGQLGAEARHPGRPQSSNIVTSPSPASELAPTTAEADPSSNTPAATDGDTTLRPRTPTDVAEAIEHERVELLQIQAMLRCLYEVLLYADDDDSVMHADVANVCARLINDSVGRLDKLLMHRGDHNSSNEKPQPEVSEPSGSEEE